MVETRRSSSSSKRSLSSPSPSNAKRSKVSEDASSTTLPSSGIIAPVNESGTGNESREPELRSSDLPDTASLKAVDDCDAMLPDKPPSVPVEGEDLVSPQCLGETAVDAEKSKVGGTAALPCRSKKRPTKAAKSGPKAAWGKLLSQCSQV